MLTTSYTLLQRLRHADDQEAWRRFVALYTPVLRIWAIRTGMTEHDADDVTQEVLLTALAKLPGFEYDASRSFKGWLRTTAENQAREFHRRRQVAGRGTGDEGLSSVLESSEIEAFWERDYSAHVATRALELMRDEFEETTWRACWEMTVHDRSAAEVAIELGITTNACFLAKSRVLRRLRESLGELCDG